MISSVERDAIHVTYLIPLPIYFRKIMDLKGLSKKGEEKGKTKQKKREKKTGGHWVASFRKL